MSKNAKRQLRKGQKEVRKALDLAKVPKGPHPVLSVEQRLRSTITALLGGPRGDPDLHHMLAAAHCILLLEQIGKPYGNDNAIESLSGKNLYEMDFLELAREDAAL
jgi:hypothetical protein